MCLNCVSNPDFVAMNAAMLGGVAKGGVAGVLETMGFAVTRSDLEKDARVVAFLRSLGVDPVAVLGETAVRAVDDGGAALQRRLNAPVMPRLSVVFGHRLRGLRPARERRGLPHVGEAIA